MEVSTETTGQAAATQSFDASPPVETPWWSFTETETLIRLHTDRTHGLSPEEALKRIKQNGPNSLPEEPEESVWTSLIEAFKDPLAVILTLAAVVSASIGLAKGETQELKQAVLIMGIV